MDDSFIAVWNSPYPGLTVGYVDDHGLSPARAGFRDVSSARDYAGRLARYADVVDFTEAACATE